MIHKIKNRTVRRAALIVAAPTVALALTLIMGLLIITESLVAAWREARVDRGFCHDMRDYRRDVRNRWNDA